MILRQGQRAEYMPQKTFSQRVSGPPPAYVAKEVRSYSKSPQNMEGG